MPGAEMEIKNKDIVSIIIRVYNRTDYICDAIKSLLDQAYDQIEIIVVNDGSTVDINDFIQNNCPSLRIRVIDKPHSGLSATLNMGIRNAKGNYLVFLDDDDLLHPEMISAALSRLKETNADMVIVGYKYFYENDSPWHNSEDFIIAGRIEYLRDLVKRNLFPINSILIKKMMLQDVGYFDETMESCEDWDLWLRIIAKGAKLESIPKCLSFIRIHKKNISRNMTLMQLGRLKVLENAKIYLDKNLQGAIHLNRQIAYRKMVVGWYLLLEGSLGAGRRMILSAISESILFLPPSFLMVIISCLPVPFLKKMNYYATLLAEFVFKSKNIYINQERT